MRLNGRKSPYSYRTMEYFKEKYPENHFYFIIGADSLFMFGRVELHPERIRCDLYDFGCIQE